MKICPYCGTERPDGEMLCPNCSQHNQIRIRNLYIDERGAYFDLILMENEARYGTKKEIYFEGMTRPRVFRFAGNQRTGDLQVLNNIKITDKNGNRRRIFVYVQFVVLSDNGEIIDPHRHALSCCDVIYDYVNKKL